MAQKTKTVFFIFVFSMSLFIGVSIGKMMQKEKEPSLEEETQILTPKSLETHKILIAGVDDLTYSQARLESVWLAEFAEGSLEISLRPLYPVASTPNHYSYLIPHDPIYVSTTDLEGLRSVELLRAQNVDWSDVIMLDEWAMDILIETTMDDIQSVSSPGDLVTSSLPKVWEDPNAALYLQENIVQFLCEHVGPFAKQESILYLMALIPNHIKSTLSRDDILNQWELWIDQDFQLICRFP
jgi:hypothetical protein